MRPLRYFEQQGIRSGRSEPLTARTVRSLLGRESEEDEGTSLTNNVEPTARTGQVGGRHRSKASARALDGSLCPEPPAASSGSDLSRYQSHFQGATYLLL